MRCDAADDSILKFRMHAPLCKPCPTRVRTRGECNRGLAPLGQHPRVHSRRVVTAITEQWKCRGALQPSMGEDLLPSPRRLVLKLVANSTSFPVSFLPHTCLSSYKQCFRSKFRQRRRDLLNYDRYLIQVTVSRRNGLRSTIEKLVCSGVEIAVSAVRLVDQW